MRPCPVCEHSGREKIFSMSYRIPDGWPLPSEIVWYTCDRCGIKPAPDTRAKVFCGLCGKPFQVDMQPAPLWQRMRRKLVVTTEPCK